MMNHVRGLIVLLALWAMHLLVENATIAQKATPSVLHCSTACVQTALCTGVSFDQDTGACTLIYSIEGFPIFAKTRQYMDTYHFTFLPVPAVYGDSCNENTGCFPAETNLLCSDGNCKCQDFYNRVPGTGFCTATCDEFGDTYEDYEGIYLKDNNIQTLPGVMSITECKDFCSNNTICRSTDYVLSTSKCSIAAVTLLDLPQQVRYGPNAFYSQRNCA